MRLKTASLDLILKANGKPTGDDHRDRMIKELEARMIAEKAAIPVYMNSKQRRRLRQMLEIHGQSLTTKE